MIMQRKLLLLGTAFLIFLILISLGYFNILMKDKEDKQEQKQLSSRVNGPSDSNGPEQGKNAGLDVYSKNSPSYSSDLLEERSNESVKSLKSGDSAGIPVLTYHSIAYQEGNPVRMPKEKFLEQMRYLKDNGYTTISLDELYMYMQGQLSLPKKPIVITFDDGYRDNYTTAFPILKSLGFKASVFVITQTIDKDDSYLTSDQIKEMDKNGISIESHTLFHDKLDSLSYQEQMDTLLQSKMQIEKILDRKVVYFAYPYGLYNNETLLCLKEAGYKMAFTTNRGWAYKNSGILLLPRVYIDSTFDMEVFKQRITNPDYRLLGGSQDTYKDNKQAGSDNQSVTGQVYTH